MVEVGYETVDNWLSRLGKLTARDNGYSFKRFVKWKSENGGKFADMSPDELVKYQKKCTNADCYEILDLLQKYINGMDLMAGSKKKEYNTVRSFFLHNRSPLPHDPSFKIRSDKPPVQGKLDVDSFKMVVLACNECHQAAFVCMFQAGMGQNEFYRWNETGYEKLIEQLKGDPEQIKVDIAGRKHHKNLLEFYTFIGRDGIQFIRKWLKKRAKDEERRRLKAEKKGEDYAPATAIFVNQRGNPLNADQLHNYWMRKLRRQGYAEKKSDFTGNRYGYHIHEIRDLFRSRWRLTGIDKDIAEFYMCHKNALDKLGYDKSPKHYPDFYEEKYQEAQPWLNIFTEDPQKVPAKELAAQRRKIAELEAKFEAAENKLETNIRTIGIAEETNPDTMKIIANQGKQIDFLTATVAQLIDEIKADKERERTG